MTETPTTPEETLRAIAKSGRDSYSLATDNGWSQRESDLAAYQAVFNAGRSQTGGPIQIGCAKCGRPMFAQDADNTPVNDSMEVCSGCSWELALWLGRSQALEEAAQIVREAMSRVQAGTDKWYGFQNVAVAIDARAAAIPGDTP